MGFAGFGGGPDVPSGSVASSAPAAPIAQSTSSNPPSIAQRAASFAKSVYRWAAEDGFAITETEVFQRRLEICQSNECGKYSAGTCKICGCNTDLKLRMPSENCPDNPPRWVAVTAVSEVKE